MKKPFVNYIGQSLTKHGHLDQRQFNRPTRENDGKPYQTFEVRHAPGDAGRPYHVYGIDCETGEEIKISRHRKEKQATLVRDRQAALQPNRKPSKQMRHKLGLPYK